MHVRHNRPTNGSGKKTSFPIRFFYILAVLVLSLAILPSLGLAQPKAPETDQILDAADAAFQAMKDRKYPQIWQHLTKKSRDGVVQSVIKGEGKIGNRISEEQAQQDFASNGPLSKAYWDGYLERFNPDMVLKESTWKMGEVKKNEAQVIIQHRKSQQPALLRMQKEDGAWKAGLEETFGILKWVLNNP